MNSLTRQSIVVSLSTDCSLLELVHVSATIDVKMLACPFVPVLLLTNEGTVRGSSDAVCVFIHRLWLSSSKPPCLPCNPLKGRKLRLTVTDARPCIKNKTITLTINRWILQRKHRCNKGEDRVKVYHNKNRKVLSVRQSDKKTNPLLNWQTDRNLKLTALMSRMNLMVGRQ